MVEQQGRMSLGPRGNKHVSTRDPKKHLGVLFEIAMYWLPYLIDLVLVITMNYLCIY